MYEKSISLAMAGKLTHQTALSLQALHAAVCYRIQCSCGSILDSRKSVLFEYPGGTAISCGPCHDKRADKVKAGVIVTDARLYKLDGTLKPIGPIFKLTKLETPVLFKLKRPIGFDGLDIPIQATKGLETHGSKFYLHGKAGAWVLTEFTSGLKVSHGQTQKELLKWFAGSMTMTTSKFQEILKHHIKIHGSANK